MADLHELLRRVEAATGKDDELGCDIIDALLPVADERLTMYVGRCPTASIDAALALVERALPGAEYRISTLYGVASAALPLNDDNLSCGRRKDNNVALAILAALLRARIAQEPAPAPAQESER